ncbi:MAG: hypothetical protein SXA11_19105 [Cyanobacteriota bacterium]|nr:hypothetical protein [Cyanobacteriota bacterium]
MIVAVGAGLISKVEARESVSDLLQNGIRLSSSLVGMFELELEKL